MKNIYCTLDTETVGGAAHPTGMYNVGAIIHDRKGEILATTSLLVMEHYDEIALDDYAKKNFPVYAERLKAGEISAVATEREAYEVVKNLCDHYGVKYVMAYNSGFDMLKIIGTNTVIGSVDFNHRHADDVLEMGYLLHPDYWGKGLMTEAARALLEVGFTLLNLHKIEIECYGYNKASQRIAEKLGFTLEARIRDRKDAQGKRCDLLRYGLLKSEWEGR